MSIDKCTIYKHEEYFDCYTIFTPDGSVYGMSEQPYSPMGFNNYIGEADEYHHGDHLGKIVQPTELNQEVIKAIKHRLEHENN
jgi:hypothetical protein